MIPLEGDAHDNIALSNTQKSSVPGRQTEEGRLGQTQGLPTAPGGRRNRSYSSASRSMSGFSVTQPYHGNMDRAEIERRRNAALAGIAHLVGSKDIQIRVIETGELLVIATIVEKAAACNAATSSYNHARLRKVIQ